MKCVLVTIMLGGLATSAAYGAAHGAAAVSTEQHGRPTDLDQREQDDDTQGHDFFPSLEVLPLYMPVSPKRVHRAQGSTQHVQDLPDSELNHLASGHVAFLRHGPFCTPEQTERPAAAQPPVLRYRERTSLDHLALPVEPFSLPPSAADDADETPVAQYFRLLHEYQRRPAEPFALTPAVADDADETPAMPTRSAAAGQASYELPTPQLQGASDQQMLRNRLRALPLERVPLAWQYWLCMYKISEAVGANLTPEEIGLVQRMFPALGGELEHVSKNVDILGALIERDSRD